MITPKIKRNKFKLFIQKLRSHYSMDSKTREKILHRCEILMIHGR